MLCHEEVWVTSLRAKLGWLAQQPDGGLHVQHRQAPGVPFHLPPYLPHGPDSQVIAFMRMTIQSCTYPLLVRSFVRSFLGSFLRSLVCSFVRICLFVCFLTGI